MITVPYATKKIIEKSRYFSEALASGLINISALARYIQPEVEAIVLHTVTPTSILIALNRLEKKLKKLGEQKNIFLTPPEMIVRSQLFEVSIRNSEELLQKYAKLFLLHQEKKRYFFTLTEGITETTIIASSSLQKIIHQLLEDEKVLSEFSDLASITIRFSPEIIQTPGIFYFFLRALSWEGISVLEVVSTYLEFTIVLGDKEANKAFTILKSLFEK